jgi:hypothetical protein
MKKQIVLLLVIALMTVPAGMGWAAYLPTPITITGFVTADGSFDARAAYYNGTPIGDYTNYSGSYTETGYNAFQGSDSSRYSHTYSHTKHNLALDNSSRTTGNAHMEGRNYDGLWTGNASIGSSNHEITVNSYNPPLNPWMTGYASIGCTTNFSGYKWQESESATATATAKVDGMADQTGGVLKILPGGEFENGDSVAMQIKFDSGELGYSYWGLWIGGDYFAPEHLFYGGSNAAEHYETEISLIVGQSYFFYYETSQSYNIHVIGGDGQYDPYSCSLQLIIPEPATMLLLSLGGLLLRKRK